MQPRDHRRMNFIAWAVLLIAMGALAGGMKEVGRRERAASKAFTVAELHQSAAGRAMHRRVSALYVEHRTGEPGTGWTRQDLERELTGGKPMAVTVKTQSNGMRYEEASYVDAESNSRFTFSFTPTDGRWGGYGSRSQGTLATPPRMARWMPQWLRLRSYGVVAAGLGWVVLLVGGVIWSVLQHAGSALVHGSLLLAVLVIGLAEAHPAYSLFSKSNDDLWIGLFMTAASGVCFVTAARREKQRRKQQVDQMLCPVCGYDLRASPDRCPECGTPAPTPATSKTPGSRHAAAGPAA